MRTNPFGLLCRCAALFATLLFGVASIAGAAGAANAPVVVIAVSGAIGPASADFIVRSLARAADDHAQAAILELDTPGGLDLSMRSIIKAILASPVPVVSFIAPGGARAASAGTYIVYASHVAAMAPGTNLGAATPIQIGTSGAPKPEASASAASGTQAGESTETRKQVHDAAAYIRGLAQLRGRNAGWAERAVREAVSLSASEALAQRVIDLTAADIPDLLAKLDGRRVRTLTGEHVLATKGAPVITLLPDWRSRFLATITDPSVALILVMIGMYGLFFEFSNPGFMLPGVAGAICLLVGLFALQLLPISFVGLGLIVLGIGFLVAEMFLPTFGTLGIGGVVAFSIGALMLIDTDVPGFGIPVGVVAGLAIVTALFIFSVSAVALKASRRPVVSGSEAMLGSVGVMLGDEIHAAGESGWATVRGERWRVQSAGAHALPARGGKVRVTARHGLTLTVEVVNEATHATSCMGSE
ncbi:NfeD family protein [Caballeronia telluris]|uniref:Nodulation competitiveness protein nfeD n=1 Tax=Caballeronia telluris TaxID=326475 RepID=A0A158IPL2_9BURK|nr:nodulation protein NfeD [Caballeronia telluris]SAL57974.1 nodulation competitiveness protein nfeD [Caballeronia telluris]SAL58458.1 nodulation competitiveness protein nfeD [Caballeronia telluris]